VFGGRTRLLAAITALGALAIAVEVTEASWRPATNLSATGLAIGDPPDVATGTDGTTVAVWSRYDGTNGTTCCLRIEARIRRPGSKFGTTRILSEAGENARAPQVAVDPGGTAIVVWARFDGTQPPFTCCTRVQARVWRPGHGLGPVQTLSAAGEDASYGDVGVGRNGRAVAIWTREESSFGPRELQARFRAPHHGGSPGFGALQSLTPSGEYAYDPKLGVAPDGRAIVIWQRYNGTENRIVAKLRAPGEPFGGQRRNLSAGGANADYPAVDMGPDGTALAAWTTDRFLPDYGVESRRVTPGGHLSAVATISKKVNENYPAVAIDARRRSSVAWEDGSPDSRIKVRTRGRHGGFGKGQFLSPLGDSAYDPVLSIAPDRTAFAGWSLAGTDYLSQARLRHAGRGKFVSLKTLSDPGDDATELRIAAGPGARAIAVWRRSDRIQAARYVP
jgi:hypothetical protein